MSLVTIASEILSAPWSVGDPESNLTEIEELQALSDLTPGSDDSWSKTDLANIPQDADPSSRASGELAIANQLWTQLYYAYGDGTPEAEDRDSLPNDNIWQNSDADSFNYGWGDLIEDADGYLSAPEVNSYADYLEDNIDADSNPYDTNVDASGDFDPEQDVGYLPSGPPPVDSDLDGAFPPSQDFDPGDDDTEDYNHVQDYVATQTFDHDFTDVSQVTRYINDRPVIIEFDNHSVSAADQSAILAKLDSASNLLTSTSSQMTASENRDVGNIQKIVISNDLGSGTDEASAQFSYNATELAQSSPAYIASAIVHDGHHISQFQDGGVAASRGVTAEMEGVVEQLSLASVLGLSTNEVAGLTAYLSSPGLIQQRLSQPLSGRKP